MFVILRYRVWHWLARRTVYGIITQEFLCGFWFRSPAGIDDLIFCWPARNAPKKPKLHAGIVGEPSASPLQLGHERMQAPTWSPVHAASASETRVAAQLGTRNRNPGTLVAPPPTPQTSHDHLSMETGINVDNLVAQSGNLVADSGCMIRGVCLLQNFHEFSHETRVRIM